MNTITVIGKGKSYKGGRPDCQKIACVSETSNFIPGKIDYLFCHDWDRIGWIKAETLLRVEHYVLPLFPHTPETRLPDIRRPAFLRNIEIYNLQTAPVKFNNIPTITAFSVMEAAVAWLILEGFNDFTFVGVSYPGNMILEYSNIVTYPYPGTLEWLKINYIRIKKRLDDNNCKYVFT